MVKKAHSLFLAALVALAATAFAQEATTPAPAPATAPTVLPDPVTPAPATPPTAESMPAPDPAGGTLPTESPPTRRGDVSLDLVPAQPGQLLSLPANEPGLIPDVPAGEAPRQGRPPVVRREKKSKTEAVEEEYAARVRFRQVQTRVLLEPALQAQWDASLKARTDQEKREILRNYYKNLYSRIRKLDKSTKAEADLREETALDRLAQKRLFVKEKDDRSRDVMERSDRGIITNDNL